MLESEFLILKAIVLSIKDLIFQLLEKESNIAFITYLLDNGIDPNSINSEGDTPLHIAAKLGYLDITQLLISRNANFYIQNKDGNTPLHMAVEYNQEEIIDEFLSHNIDQRVKNRRKQTALLKAVQKNYESIAVKLVNKGGEINTTDTWKNTPLHYTSLTGNENLAQHLIDVYTNRQPENKKSSKKIEFVNKTDDNGETALHVSARKGISTMTMTLINNGANTNIPNYNFFTPLHISAEKGDLATVKLLLDNNAVTTIKDIQGYTPLRRAVINGKENVLDELINRGVTDVESEDKQGNTTLHDAYTKGLDTIVEKLINAGANQEKKNKRGKKPIDYNKNI